MLHMFVNTTRTKKSPDDYRRIFLVASYLTQVQGSLPHVGHVLPIFPSFWFNVTNLYHIKIYG